MGIAGSTGEGELLGESLWLEEDTGKVWEKGEKERRERTVVNMAGTVVLASGDRPEFRAVTNGAKVGVTIVTNGAKVGGTIDGLST